MNFFNIHMDYGVIHRKSGIIHTVIGLVVFFQPCMWQILKRYELLSIYKQDRRH